MSFLITGANIYILHVLFELLICLCVIYQNLSIAPSCQEYEVQTPYFSSQGPPKYSLICILQSSQASFLPAYLHISTSMSLLITFPPSRFCQLSSPGSCHMWSKKISPINLYPRYLYPSSQSSLELFYLYHCYGLNCVPHPPLPNLYAEVPTPSTSEFKTYLEIGSLYRCN